MSPVALIIVQFSSHILIHYVIEIIAHLVGLDGFGVTCSPRDPRFAGSNPAEVDGRKNPEHKHSGRDFKLGVPSLRFQAS